MDFITGVRADLPIMGKETCESMGITFHEEEAALETPIITISRGSTPKLAGSGEGPSLPS